MAMLWLDVEDLFDYVRLRARPTGIQRLSLELYASLHAIAPARIGFVTRSRRTGETVLVDWAHVDAIYRRMSAPAAPAPAASNDGTAEISRLAAVPLIGKALYGLAQKVPAEMRASLGGALYAQVESARHLASFVRRAARAVTGRRSTLRLEPWEEASEQEGARRFAQVAQPGDILLALGAPWADADYAAYVTRLTEAHGLRFGMLVYDLIPVVRPEFFERRLSLSFARFLSTTLPLAHSVFAISQATAADTARWAKGAGVPLRNPPRVLPIGTGFRAIEPAPALPQGLQAGGYVLFVSTIEARKNHLLAFRAWRRLLDTMPAGTVPKLVFAGRVGWMIGDLMQALRNCDFLDGHVVLVEEADDAVIAALYRGARFTIFPSHYEGWGLPVSESLAFGKVCIGSSSTSIPEAGGPFCLYHDPDDATQAAALYRRALEEEGLIEGLEASIRGEWRPVSWQDSARALLDTVGQAPAEVGTRTGPQG